MRLLDLIEATQNPPYDLNQIVQACLNDTENNRSLYDWAMDFAEDTGKEVDDPYQVSNLVHDEWWDEFRAWLPKYIEHLAWSLHGDLNRKLFHYHRFHPNGAVEAGRNDTTKVYRAIDIRSLRNMKRKDFGVYWSFEEDAAEAHWGTGSMARYVFVGEINANRIDWTRTLIANLTMPDEKEIQLRPGSPVRLISAHLRGSQRPVNLGKLQNLVVQA